MRKSYPAKLKAKVALEAVKGDRSLAELSARYEVHATQIGQWRKALLAGLPELFNDKRRKQKDSSDVEKAQLYEEIGRLKMEMDWLKKRV